MNSSNYTDSESNISYTYEDIFEQIQQVIKPEATHWIYLCLFTVVFLVGTVGNFLVCYSVWRSNNLKNVTNYFLVNLSVADFFVILVCLPPSISFDMLSSWFLGLAMCKLTAYLQV